MVPTAAPPPAALQRRLAALQRVLTHATDFGVPFGHFDVHIASHPELWSCSRDGHDPALLEVLQRAVIQVVGDRARLDLTMFEVPGTGFWHGMGTARARAPSQTRRKVLYYFYFERTGLGLVGMGNHGRSGGVDHLLRFQLVKGAVALPDPGSPLTTRAQA